MKKKDTEARARIGHKIAELRKGRKMRQADLAEAVGLKQQAVARIEGGAVSVGLDILQAVAAYFGRDVDFVPRE